MNEEWLNNLRNKIEQHTEPAPEGLWEDIEHELFPEEKKRFVFLKPDMAKAEESDRGFKIYLKAFLRVASVILLVLFTKNIVTQTVSPVTNNLVIPKKEFAENNENVQSLLITENKKPVAKTIENQPIEVPISPEENKLSSDVALLENKIEWREENTDIEFPKMAFPKNESSEVAFQENTFPTKKRFTASILTGQISSGSAQQHSGFTSMTAKPMEAHTIIEENTFSAILARNSSETAYTDIKHKSPVTVGISVLYQLTSKLSLGSGLTYTKLVSELQAGNESDYIRTRQTLNYIGIPVHLNYLIFESKRLATYASSGASFDKSIGGNRTTQYTLNPISEDGPKEKLTDKTVQISVNALLGVQYKINSQLGIYLEPGVNYYFQNQSEHSTLFKEKPLMVNTRMGLRFTLNK
jgi:hypothetical protein